MVVRRGNAPRSAGCGPVALLLSSWSFLDFAGWTVVNTMTALNNQSRTGRRYDREFQNNAVALVRSGRTVTEVARDQGVSKWSLGRWVEQAKTGQALSEPKTLSVETADQRELRRLRQELEYVSRQRDILKKALGILSAEPSGARQPKGGVSESGFAAHRRKALRQPRRRRGIAGAGGRASRRQHDAQLRPLIGQSFAQSWRTYGCLRVRLDLQEHGQRCGKNRIARLMRESGLRPRQKRRFRPRTTDSRQAHPIAETRLAKVPAPDRPGLVWQSAFTYLETAEGWLFLAFTLDACTRRCVAHHCRPDMRGELPTATLALAVHRQPPPPGLLHLPAPSRLPAPPLNSWLSITLRPSTTAAVGTAASATAHLSPSRIKCSPQTKTANVNNLPTVQIAFSRKDQSSLACVMSNLTARFSQAKFRRIRRSPIIHAMANMGRPRLMLMATLTGFESVKRRSFVPFW